MDELITTDEKNLPEMINNDEDSELLRSVALARGERLRRVRNLANLDRKDLCDGKELNIHTLKGWETGRYGGLSEKGARRVIQRVASEGVFLNLEWLMHNVGVGPTVVTDYHRIQQVPAEYAHQVQRFEEEDLLIIKELRLFRKHYKYTLDLIVADTSMAPLFQPGDYVAGVARTGKHIADAVGENCIVQTMRGEIFFRKVMKGATEGSYNLVAINPEANLEKPILYDMKIISCAPVVWKRTRNA
jgi:transcriptional regulator with XRE-family HTH domain